MKVSRDAGMKVARLLGPVSKAKIALPPPGPPEVAREGARWITGSLAASTIPGLSGFKRDRLKTFI